MYYSIPMVYAYMPNLVSIGLLCRPLLAKTPNFYSFFGLRHLVLSPIGSSPRKMNTGAQLQTFPCPTPTASKSFLHSNAFTAKSGAQSLTFKSVTNKQTNRQTQKTQRFLATPAAGEIRAHQTWGGDRGPRAVLAPVKLTGYDAQFRRWGALKISG